MATGTVYLDVDDEITSAAARIRGSEATKVVLVVPYGSRIATSRMNFRLLSREAVVNNRRLSIVASDAATRALAASAGLPVFASVAEFDAASTPGDGTSDTAAASPPTDAKPDDGPPGGAGAATIVAGATAAGASGATGTGAGAAADAPATPRPKSRSKAKAAAAAAALSDETQRVAVPPAPAAAVPPRTENTNATPSTAALTAAAVGVSATTGAAAAGTATGGATGPTATGAGAAVRPVPTVRVPVARSRRTPRMAPIAIAIAGIAVLAVVALAVAGYVFLPSAEITLTPKEEPIPPISLTVRADPDATETDAEAGVVPAERLEVPVEVTETFETQGRRVEEAAATGTVTFRNVDFTEANTIAAGSIVSTQGGVRFSTDRAVTVPKAGLVGLQVVPTEANVTVTASKAGTAGNVEPNTITVIPAAEDPTTLSVRNKAATSGGTHEEFPQVSEAEVTAALEKLNADLGAAFTAAVEDGAGAPANTTVYPTTAALGASSPTVDPTTIIGKEVPSFELGVTANGTVIAVDDSPVEGIAEERLLANVGDDYRLVEGSTQIDAGEGTVSNGQVTFPVTASASRVRILDPAELLTLVKGKSLVDAEAALEPFGQVDIVPWPDWVSSIPTTDSRVSLVIVGQDGAAGDGPAGCRRRARTERGGRVGVAGRRREPVTRLLGVDLGERRIGLAVADRDGGRALPLTTLTRKPTPEADADALARIVEAERVDEIVVGLPLHAGGDEGSQADATRSWVELVAPLLGLPVTFRDERLTSYLAEQRVGPMKRGRSGGPPTRAQRDAYRARIDREAAAIILQDELDARATAGPANHAIHAADPSPRQESASNGTETPR